MPGASQKTKTLLAAAISLSASCHCFGDTVDIWTDTRFFAGASMGISEFEFPEKLDHNIYLPMTQLLLGSTYKQFQLSISTSVSLNNADVSEEELTGEASRKEYDITFGYAVTPELTVVLGYKDAEIEIDYEPRDPDLVLTETDESYQQDGFYIGVNYTWRFERAGNLTASLAYADLDADNLIVSDEATPLDPNAPPAPGEEVELDDFGQSIEGDSTGYSAGVTWTMPLAGQLLYQAQVKVNDYRQDLTIGRYSFDDVNTRFTAMSMGVSYVF